MQEIESRLLILSSSAGIPSLHGIHRLSVLGQLEDHGTLWKLWGDKRRGVSLPFHVTK